jgi:hypothetical protein
MLVAADEMCKMKRKCKMLHMLIHQLALVGSHMKLGLSQNTLWHTLFEYKDYSQGTIIFASTSVNGFYTKL